MSILIEKPLISQEDAFKLLFEDSSIQEVKTDCFDGFGNYTYPTDFTVDKPNIAIGSSDGFQVLNLINSK